jgi:hypothetical protein
MQQQTTTWNFQAYTCFRLLKQQVNARDILLDRIGSILNFL